MIEKAVVDLIIAYFNECRQGGKAPTLVGLHWYVDGHYKQLPLTEEVNKALSEAPDYFVHRINGRVYFVAAGCDRIITNDDMRVADQIYRKEFNQELKKLKGRK